MRTSAAVLALVLAGVLALAGAAGGPDVQSGPTVFVDAPGTVSPDADQVDIPINIRDVDNFGGFTFVLSFDPAVVRALDVVKDEFLGSSGRETFCNEPTIEDSAVRLECVSLRATPEGPDGGGTIAVVKLEPVAEGTTQLALSRVRIVRPEGSEIQVQTEDAELKVDKGGNWFSDNWLLLALVGGGVLLVLIALGAASRRRASRAV